MIARRVQALRDDPWVEAAAAVRHAVLTTDGVADLSGSALYQIQGPGQSVRGVSVSLGPGGLPFISVAIVLDAAVAADADLLSGVCRRVRKSAESAWARASARVHSERPLPDVAVHVVDVADGVAPTPIGSV